MWIKKEINGEWWATTTIDFGEAFELTKKRLKRLEESRTYLKELEEKHPNRHSAGMNPLTGRPNYEN
jgi:hypothetical protein